MNEFVKGTVYPSHGIIKKFILELAWVLYMPQCEVYLEYTSKLFTSNTDETVHPFIAITSQRVMDMAHILQYLVDAPARDGKEIKK